MSDEAPPLSAVMMLAMEARALAPLSEWEPVGVLIEEILLAASGDGGLDARDVRRLRVWSSNWSQLREDLRLFYSRNHGNPAVSEALWWVLGTGSRPRSWRVSRAYEDLHGHPPACDLLPKPSHTEGV